MTQLVTRLVFWLQTLLGMGLIAMVGLSVYNVFRRYVLNDALLWADEAAVFAMIVIAWLGAIVVCWKHMEIRMDFLADAAPSRIKRALDLMRFGVTCGVCFWCAWLSYGYVAKVHQFNMTSDAARIPVWYFHAAITIGLVAMGVLALVRLVAETRTALGYTKQQEPLK